ncbi:MAG: hypothetical protein ABI672_03890 [Vicinamibacteria bacterium]
MTEAKAVPVKEWIFIPAIVTLAITLVRLVGELMQWSPVFFSRAGGGAGAIIGIVWLVPILGIYFALKLRNTGERPKSVGKAFGLVVLAFVLTIAVSVLGAAMGINPLQGIVVTCLALFASILVVKPGWPALARLLWSYGLAARIPVILVMLVAILADWGTHYDVAPPGFPALNPIIKWLLIGVFPQITLWMGFTVVVGMLFGVITIAVAGKKG